MSALRIQLLVDFTGMDNHNFTHPQSKIKYLNPVTAFGAPTEEEVRKA